MVSGIVKVCEVARSRRADEARCGGDIVPARALNVVLKLGGYLAGGNGGAATESNPIVLVNGEWRRCRVLGGKPSGSCLAFRIATNAPVVFPVDRVILSERPRATVRNPVTLDETPVGVPYDFRAVVAARHRCGTFSRELFALIGETCPSFEETPIKVL